MTALFALQRTPHGGKTFLYCKNMLLNHKINVNKDSTDERNFISKDSDKIQ